MDRELVTMAVADADVTVIGGGIVGISSALELQRRGRTVTLIEPGDPGIGTAAGSAGYLSDSHIFPIAKASTVLRIPQMLADPLGPLVIRPQYAPRMLGWGIRFLMTLLPSRTSAVIAALASLNRSALKDLFELGALEGAGQYLSREGALSLCLTEGKMREQRADIPAYRAHDINVEEVTRNDISQLEPALAKEFIGGLFFPQEARCIDPGAFGRRLAGSFFEKGGLRIPDAAISISQRSDGEWDIRLGSGDTLRSNVILVSAGVWSRKLLRQLGYTVPLETERGYHLMLPEPGVALKRPVVFAERRFAATQMLGGLRLAGTAEFAGLNAAMDPRRSDVLYELARPYLPGLNNNSAVRWMGYRPTLPDSLPAIGQSSRHRNLFYNFGHQHLGLTQSATSAHILSDIVSGSKPNIDATPFSLDRFS